MVLLGHSGLCSFGTRLAPKIRWLSSLPLIVYQYRSSNYP